MDTNLQPKSILPGWQHAAAPWNANTIYDSGNVLGMLALDRGFGVQVIKSSEDKDVAYIASICQEESERKANAALISSAPDLLAALEDISLQGASPMGDTEQHFFILVKIADRALAKLASHMTG